MKHFIQFENDSEYQSAFYFAFFVWTIPILIIISLDSLANEGFVEVEDNQSEIPRTLIKSVYSQLFIKIKSFLPNSPNKKE